MTKLLTTLSILLIATSSYAQTASINQGSEFRHLESDMPQDVENYERMGLLYYEQGDYEEAMKVFEKILEIEPENSRIMHILGSLYLENGNEESAIEILKEAISIDPKNDRSLNTLGYIYSERGELLDEALELVKQATEISPQNGGYWDSLGWVYFKKGQYEKALEALTKAYSLMEDPVIKGHLDEVNRVLNTKINEK